VTSGSTGVATVTQKFTMHIQKRPFMKRPKLKTTQSTKQPKLKTAHHDTTGVTQRPKALKEPSFPKKL
jgi:hypothetical protein